jgi:ureidoacrylate peracid hydrolase
MPWEPLPKTVTLTFTTPKPEAFMLDPAKTALVIVDMQNRFCKGTSKRCTDAIEGNVRLLTKAREAGVKVIFIQSVRSLDALEVIAFGKEPFLVEGTPEVEIVSEIAPLPTEIVIQKRSHDPFARTQLDETLKREGILPTETTVIVTGVSAAVCAHAASLGFSNRHYMTLVPMDCQAAQTVEDEARIYDQYQQKGYAYDMAFTLSTLIEFAPVFVESAELAGATA